MTTVNIEDFARQLIADKCSALIEREHMLPENILCIVKRARDDYFNNPSAKNYENIKWLFSQTKYVDDAIDYKDFNRRMLLIAFKFGLNKGKDYFKNYRGVLEVALKRLDGRYAVPPPQRWIDHEGPSTRVSDVGWQYVR